MKFRITFKSPDALYQSVNDAAYDNTTEIIDDEERRDKMSEIREELTEFAGKWVEYNEYITVEFDMENKTAVVIPR